MARMTRRARGAPRWTRDDILREAAGTFALLPRPSTAARCAFVALLGEFWSDVSDGTRVAVEDALRGSSRVGVEVLEALDALLTEAKPVAETGRPTLIAHAASVSHREGMNVSATVSGAARAAVPVEERSGARLIVNAPPLAHEALEPFADEGTGDEIAELATEAPADAASHVRAVIAHLAEAESDAAPALQPAEIEATLAAASSPTSAIATLLDITMERAESVVVMPRARGIAIAMRALGVDAGTAEALVHRWRGRAPSGFAKGYAALSLADCLGTVASWRRQDGALRAVANAGTDTNGQRRSA